MTDHFARPAGAASSDRLSALHKQCDEDYAKGQAQRATAGRWLPTTVAPLLPPMTGELDAAISIAQKVLAAYGTVEGGIHDWAQAHGGITEALRILLRALNAEPAQPTTGPRCPATHPEDPTPCDGPPVVTVLDRTNAGTNGCTHHGARLLASLEGGRVYALPGAPPGTAIAVFKAAADTRPYAWVKRGEGK
ncbi:hypothetical protein [Streptomyces pseudovenezuelae]|uniref:hypothetical protein n=1 Tax=Streptomyces pseudovenezuelae TaxID=67350 RepID=UPI0036E60673